MPEAVKEKEDQESNELEVEVLDNEEKEQPVEEQTEQEVKEEPKKGPEE